MAHDVVGAILGTMECPPMLSLSEELPLKSKRSDSTVETGKNMLREAGKNNENRSENGKHNEQGHANNAITQKQNEQNKMAAVQAKHGSQNKAKAVSTKTNKQSTSTSNPNKKSKGSCDSKSSSSKSHRDRDTVNRKEFEKVTDQLKQI